MRPIWLRIAETLLLFGALAFCVPPLPSQEAASLPLFPGAAFATLLFAASRVLRWRPTWWPVVVETLLFGAFAFVLNRSINMLYNGLLA